MKNANIIRIFTYIICYFPTIPGSGVRHLVLDGHNILFKDPGSKSGLSSDPSRALNSLIARCGQIIGGKIRYRRSFNRRMADIFEDKS